MFRRIAKIVVDAAESVARNKMLKFAEALMIDEYGRRFCLRVPGIFVNSGSTREDQCRTDVPLNLADDGEVVPD